MMTLGATIATRGALLNLILFRFSDGLNRQCAVMRRTGYENQRYWGRVESSTPPGRGTPSGREIYDFRWQACARGLRIEREALEAGLAQGRQRGAGIHAQSWQDTAARSMRTSQARAPSLARADHRRLQHEPLDLLARRGRDSAALGHLLQHGAGVAAAEAVGLVAAAARPRARRSRDPALARTRMSSRHTSTTLVLLRSGST